MNIIDPASGDNGRRIVAQRLRDLAEKLDSGRYSVRLLDIRQQENEIQIELRLLMGRTIWSELP